MSIYSKFLTLMDGLDRSVDLAHNTLSLGSAQLNGSTSGAFTQNAAAVTTPYAVNWPAAQGSANTYLRNDGSGNLTWVTVAGGVSSVALADASDVPIYAVSGSPVTNSGTLTLTLANQVANSFFAGPVLGAPGQPSFRGIDFSDLPALPYANDTLSNLSTVALNTDLLPGNLGFQNVGTIANYFNTIAGLSSAIVDANSGFATSITSPILSANLPFVLPPDIGTAGYVLNTDGAGNTSWAPAASSGADQQLSNLSGTIAIPLSLLPATAGAIAVGSSVKWFHQVFNRNYLSLNSSGVIQGQLYGDGLTTPSGKTSGLTLVNDNTGVINIGIFTQNETSQNSADLILETGNINAGTFNTGSIFHKSGDSTTGTGNSGDIVNAIGTSVGGTRGKFRITDGSEGTVGHVWTSTDTSGGGHWAASGGGGGANTTLSNLGTTAINASLVPASAATISLGASGKRYSALYVDQLFGHFVGGDHLAIDLDASIIYDQSTLDSLNFNSRTLLDAGTNLALNWSTRQLFDTPGIQSIDWGGRVLTDPSGTAMLDWNSGFLFAADGSTATVKWRSNQLVDNSGNTILDWQNGTISNNFSNQIAITFGATGNTLKDASGVNSVIWDTRSLRDNTAQTVVDWANTALQDHTQALALDWGSDTSFLRIGPAKGLVAANNSGIYSRNAADNADIQMIFVDAFNRTTINGLSGSNIIFNNSFIPSNPDTFSMGVLGDGLLDVFTNTVQLSQSGATLGQINFTSNDPLNNGVGTGVTLSTVGISRNLYLYTANGTATKTVYLESGNASAGNSGDIALAIGSATGTRGKIRFTDGSEGTAGYVWTSTDTLGNGTWMPATGGGANTTLSNLGTTSINTDLIPSADFAFTLGSLTEHWNQLFVSQIADINGNPALQPYSWIAVGSDGGTTSIDWDQRILYDTNSAETLDWQNHILYGLSNGPALDFSDENNIKIGQNLISPSAGAGNIGDTTDGYIGQVASINLTLVDNVTSPFASSPNNITISSPALAASYGLVLPIDVGTNGDALTTDGSGNLSWASSAKVSVNSSVYLSSFVSITNPNPIIFDGVQSDPGSHYNTSTGEFTCPEDGNYLVTCCVQSNLGQVNINLYRNTTLYNQLGSTDVTLAVCASGSTVIFCNSGDTLKLVPSNNFQAAGDPSSLPTVASFTLLR